LDSLDSSFAQVYAEKKTDVSIFGEESVLHKFRANKFDLSYQIASKFPLKRLWKPDHKKVERIKREFPDELLL